jgi:hypothetical protein
MRSDEPESDTDARWPRPRRRSRRAYEAERGELLYLCTRSADGEREVVRLRRLLRREASGPISISRARAAHRARRGRSGAALAKIATPSTSEYDKTVIAVTMDRIPVSILDTVRKWTLSKMDGRHRSSLTLFKYQRERITILRAFVEINKLPREAFGQHNARDQNALGIQAIIALGHLEGRPLNASNISDYLGIPRTTVIRKLRWLIEEGFIEQKDRTYYLAPKYMNLPDEVYTKLFDAIHRLSAELSKIDSKSPCETVSVTDSVQNGHKEPERQQ